jgi:predicted dithiol-disulfide oxidoreductase (DUF899 family)
MPVRCGILNSLPSLIFDQMDAAYVKPRELQADDELRITKKQERCLYTCSCSSYTRIDRHAENLIDACPRGRPETSEIDWSRLADDTARKLAS